LEADQLLQLYRTLDDEPVNVFARAIDALATLDPSDVAANGLAEIPL